MLVTVFPPISAGISTILSVPLYSAISTAEPSSIRWYSKSPEVSAFAVTANPGTVTGTAVTLMQDASKSAVRCFILIQQSLISNISAPADNSILHNAQRENKHFRRIGTKNLPSAQTQKGET